MKKLMMMSILVAVLLTSCAPPSIADTSTNVAQQEQNKQAVNQSKYTNDTPNMGNGSTTLERTNLKKRMEGWNDPNKMGYIYLLSDNGIIMAFFTIKGKVSSLNSYLTGGEMIVSDPNAYYDNRQSLLMESPDFDGSYGDNGGGIFFFLTDGTYMEWNGMYLLADQPIKLSQQPVMTYSVK